MAVQPINGFMKRSLSADCSMGVFEVFILAVIVVEILFTLQVNKNYRYARHHLKDRCCWRPACLLIVPCKGLDQSFERNIRSFYTQDFDGYRLRFVVQNASDPAYAELKRLNDLCAPASKAKETEILIAGRTAGCSQKLHNLLAACRSAPPDAEVFVFADSDACAGTDWLAHLVSMLQCADAGLSSGYRWFVPQRSNLATLALSAMNAKVYQLLGKTPFNLAWGGSMAIRRELFERLEIDRIWSASLSDDLSVSQAVRKAGLRTYFAPACVVASYVSTTWSALWEFARRQFIITRIYAPAMWLFGLCGAVLSVAGLWGGLALSVWAISARPVFWIGYMALFGVFLVCQIVRAALRQRMASRLLPDDQSAMRSARWADWLGFWAWCILLLVVIAASAVGRTITWRGIRYRIHSPTEIEILDSVTDAQPLHAGGITG